MKRLVHNFLFFCRLPHYCNVCGYRVRFNGPVSPEGLICPICCATSRDRMLIFCFQRVLVRKGIYKSLEGVLPLLYNSRLGHLDKTVVETSPRLGGNYGRYMRIRFNYIDTDYDDKAFRAARREDLQALTFESNSIDFVLSSHVLEHVPDQRSALREIYRVIKPGGAAFLQVPIYYFQTARVEAEEYHADHTRVFWHTGWDLANRLENEGFSVSIAVTEDLYDYIYRGKKISLVSEPWDVAHMYRDMERLRTLPFENFCDERAAKLYGILPACNHHVFVASKE